MQPKKANGVRSAKNSHMTKKLSHKYIRKALTITLALVTILTTVTALTACSCGGTAETTSETYVSQEGDFNDDDWGTTISYNGETYKKKSDIKTFLFLGLDAGDGTEAYEPAGTERADTIVLFVIDESTKDIQIVELSRNSMVDVDVYNKDREKLFTNTMQICLQYLYADSRARGNHLMKNKVSDVLLGVTIDDVLALQMDGIPVIVDYMGGIEITMEEDCTYIDASYTEGAKVTMDGAAAERFVRNRDTKVTGSNENSRMARQTWFMKQFFQIMKSKGGSFMAKAMDEAKDYIETDMSSDTISDILKGTMNDEVKVIPGEVSEGTYGDEYNLDQQGLKEMVIDLYYEKVS